MIAQNDAVLVLVVVVSHMADLRICAEWACG